MNRLKVILIAVFLATSSIQQLEGSETMTLAVDKGTFTLTLSDVKSEVIDNVLNFTISGTIRNDTGFDYTGITLELIGYDVGWKDLKLCGRLNEPLTCELQSWNPS